MTSVDTNIIVRFLTRDDEAQYRKSLKVFRQEKIFVPDTVVLETVWGLKYGYSYENDAVCDALEKMFGLANVCLLNPSTIFQALQCCRAGLDCADAFHLAGSLQNEKMLTCDKKFIRAAKGLCPCRVEAP